MKYALSVALALLLLPWAAMAQETPDDRYIAIYDLIQLADNLNDGGSPKDAQAKYTEAQTDLKKFQSEFPTWNVKIVNFRLNYLAAKLNAVGISTAAPATETTADSVAKIAATVAPSDTDNQIKTLQDKLQQAQTDKSALEAKLKELSAAPAATNNNALALAEIQAQLQSLQDENALLKESVKQSQAKAAKTVDADALNRLQQDLTDAKQRLDDQAKAIDSLTQEKETLQKKLAAVGSPDDKAAVIAAQVTALRSQIQQAEADKAALADKLKAAQAAAATTVDASKLQQAEAKIRDLQKENNLLRVSVEQGQTGSIQLTNSVALEQLRQSLDDLNRKLQEQTDLVAKLNREKAELQKKLDAASNSATTKELAQTKKDLAALKRKFSIQTDAAIILISEANLKLARMAKVNTNLTAQNKNLQKQLSSLASNAKFVVEGLRTENESLRKQAADSKKSGASVAAATNNDSPEMELLQGQLATLRAKVNVLEAQPVPFSPEELALFRRPETASLASNTGDKKSRPKLPSGAADLIAEAQRLFSQHNYQEAQAKYQEVLKLDSKNVYTLANLATIELELDKLDDAEKHVLQALAIKPKDAFSLGVLGNLRFRQAKYDLALEALSHAAQINPNDAEIQNFLGVTLSQKGQRGPAETALRKAIQLDPEYGSAHNNLAVIYLTQNPPQIELARWHYQKALAAGQSRNAELEKLLEDTGDKPAVAKP
jgi:Flp pilus assembly protein TadD